MSLYSMLAAKGPSGFGYGSTAEEVTSGLDLRGKTILVTGVSSGLGLETARVLALRGARVLGTARTEDKAREAVSSAGAEATPLACELAEPVSIRACAQAVRALDVPLDPIVCNAGVMALPSRQTAFGIELQLFTNHIGHFMLVNLLLDRLSESGRVVVLSSSAHKSAPRGGIRFDDLGAEKNYRPWRAYGQSKLANILFAKELARRFEGTNKTANALHPGVIQTKLARHMGAGTGVAYAIGNAVALKSIPQGAATQCYVAVHPGAASINGEYFADCNVARPRPDANDPELAKKLWEVSEQIVAGPP